jgi:gluconate 2-dehydrogenase gamma chain
MEAGLSRRELFQFLSAATAFSALQLSAAEPDAPLFFSKDDFATLELITEILIPADDHSPGAHEAGVAKYIDRMVAEAFDPEEKSNWEQGLALINELSRSTNGTVFLKATAEQEIATLQRLASNEENPRTKAERFFGQVKQTTAFVYYSTSLGIHQEIGYKGNVILEQFVGYDAI